MLKLIIALISNLTAVLVAKYLVIGFDVTNNIAGFAIVVALFTIANSFLLPMLRFIAKPFSWLTLGVLPLILNGVLIYAVDFISAGITINGLLSLLFATIIIGIINALFALGARAFD